MVKSQCRFVATVTTLFATATLLLNQQESSLTATLLLSDIILMFVVCASVLAPARAENRLSAGQIRLANETQLFHTTSKVGLQAYHIQT